MEPLFIGNYELGQHQNLKPFMIPEKAWSQLLNTYVFRGRVTRKPGYTMVGRFQRTETAQALGTTSMVGGTFSGNIVTILSLETNASFSTTSFSVTVGGDVFTDTNPPTGQLTGSTGGTGTFNYATGDLTLTGAPNNTAITTTFTYFPQLPVMGLLTRELPSISTEQTVGFDTTYAYAFTASGWAPLPEFSGTTTWSGSLPDADNNFFWGLSYWQVGSNNVLFWVTNFSGPSGDPIRYYTIVNPPASAVVFGTVPPTAPCWVPFAPIVQADGANDAAATKLQQCLMLIPYKGRLLAFNTWEGATLLGSTQFKNRVRWSQNGDPTTIGHLSAPNVWDPANTGAWASDIIGKGGFFDAPTGEAIVSAGFVKDQLIVYFERSSWQLLYTGNEILPFIWQRINAELGAEATFSNVRFDNGLICFGNIGLHACNGQSTERIDSDIPDLVFNISDVIPSGETNANTKRVYGIRDFFRELVYWTYVSNDPEGGPQLYPDSVLCYNYRNNTFSQFDDHFTCYGYFQPTESGWNKLPYSSWDEWAAPWNSGALQQERDVIAGNQQGFTFGLTPGAEDQGKISNDQAIAIQAISGNTITSHNHNLDVDSFQLINNTIGTLTRNGLPLNGQIIFVTSTTQNTFTIDGAGIVGTYFGGGTLQPLSNIVIQTKQFPPFWNKGRRYRLTKVRYLLDRTADGEVAVNIYTDGDDTTSLTDPKEIANTGLLGNGVVTTAANPDLTYQKLQTQIWQSQFTWVEGDSFQVVLTFNDAEMMSLPINSQAVTLHGMVMYFEPAGEFR